MASGRTLDIRQPDRIRVGKTSAVVFSFSKDDNRYYERVDMLGLPQIEAISHLEPEPRRKPTIRVIQEIVFAKTFRPFSLQTTTGRVYEVHGEDSVAMGHNYLTVSAAPRDDPDGEERTENVLFTEIETIGYLDDSIHS